jgi:hypothetical protein
MQLGTHAPGSTHENPDGVHRQFGDPGKNGVHCHVPLVIWPAHGSTDVVVEEVDVVVVEVVVVDVVVVEVVVVDVVVVVVGPQLAAQLGVGRVGSDDAQTQAFCCMNVYSSPSQLSEKAGQEELSTQSVPATSRIHVEIPSTSWHV